MSDKKYRQFKFNTAITNGYNNLIKNNISIRINTKCKKMLRMFAYILNVL